MKADGFLRVLRIIFLIFIVVFFCPYAYGKIIYADDDGQADFDNIQVAIDEANDGDTVLVAPGTYTDEGNRDIDFKGKAITVKSEEGPQTCIIDCQGSEYEQHRGFYFHNGEDTNSILQGFTITNGHDNKGGAIYCNVSSPGIKNCLVTENTARRGGGIACDSSNVVIDNCIIIGNQAEKDRGGGIFCFSGSPHILGCLIEDNTTFKEGGGVQCESSNVTFSRCIIRNNFADRGGGIDCHGGVTITNCFIIGNNAKSRGGGMNCRDETTIINSFITGNKTGGSGGGIHCNVEISLLNCTIFGNSASSYSFGGGGIHLNAGRISNSIIYGNITRKTTGIEIAQGPHGAAGCRPESIKITNSVVGSDSNAIDDPHCYSGEWLHTDPLLANPGFWDSNGTPNDPNDDFWVEGDYHLKSQAGRWDSNSQSWVVDDVTSPCIDAGDPNSPIGHEPFPNGGIINMGAYGGTTEASKSPSGLHAKYGGGTGEPNNPYLIYTAEHLNNIGTEPNDWHKHFKLMADIDMAGYSYNQALIAPDVDTDEYYFQGNPYAGVFNGNGHTISNLTITGVSYLGLFGELAFGSTVKDLGIVDVNISGSGDVAGGLSGHIRWGSVVIRCYSTGTVNGDDNIGGLVGSNGGHMRQCYSNSSVSGNYIVGGLLGGNEGGASVTNCYSTGTVNGNDNVAGLVGFNLGEVTHCYSAGAVTGDQRIGGLVGWNYGNIHSSFWDIQTSGQANMCGSQEEGASGCDDSFGLTTDEMQTAGTFLEAGWDFVDETTNGTEDIWWILEGQDYPRLWWEPIIEKQ